MEPLLSVCIITYNHKDYIRQALEGVLMQQVNFPFEIIIADDFSTDGTREVIIEYQQKNPDLIKLILQQKNVGAAQNWKELVSLPKSKYIAYFEGDDYWTDPDKLQRQVNFLEANPAYSLCSTRYKIKDALTGKITNDDLPDLLFKDTDGVKINLDIFFSHWITKTLTVMFRNSFFDLTKIGHYQYYKDTHLFYHLIKSGPGYCHNNFSAVYNLHHAGIWSGKGEIEKLQTGYKVYRELYKSNKKDLPLKNKYLEQLRALIDTKIGAADKPLINVSIYRYMFEYLTIIKSWQFLRDRMKQMYKNSNIS